MTALADPDAMSSYAMQDAIANALSQLHHRIQAAQQRYPQQHAVTLCAVSKAQPAAHCRAAYQAGQRLFGENYVQEAIQKMAELQDCAIEWHFIGPIQSNKTTLIAQHFDWVQSVDRLKIAQRLSAARPAHLAPLNICLQINSSLEESKSGASEDEVLTLAMQINQLPNLRLRGLMAIPAPSTEFQLQRDQFSQVRRCYEQLQASGLALDTLSIGMSGDFEAAIAEGATLVRIGAALFGARPPRHSMV